MGDSKRKLAFDQHSNCFIFESKIEALDRTSEDKQKKAETLNRNQEAQLDSYKKLLEQEEHILALKRYRQMNDVRDSLREHVAYRRVLNRIKHKNDREIKHKDTFGQYGPQVTTRTQLQVQLEDELNRMNPQEKRRKEVKRLLGQRKPTEPLDRTLPDDVILWSGQRRCYSTNADDAPQQNGRRRLLLPPLAVSMNTYRVRGGACSTGSGSVGKCSDMDEATETASLPAIF